jgi:SAM-dependent methyltransferase
MADLRHHFRALLMDPPRALRPLFRAARELRWRRATWSSRADQEFHDQAFAGADYFPFTFSYPGYVTIRRFADLAEPYLPATGHVLDIGCGPGEITCELARRQPGVRFTGIDHSIVAVERARRNAARLQLSNISFRQGSAESFDNASDIDLVTMFDSFHHVPDPGPFVKRLAQITSTVFLIEPAGNVLGQWQARMDFDWVLTELDKVRRRADHQCGVVARPLEQSAHPAASPSGTAIEHRYPIAEYERLFEGFGLSLQGTIAGFQQYPPDAFSGGPLKEHFGRFVYDTIVQIEREHIHGKRDLDAKHWAILARRGSPSQLPRLSHSSVRDRLPEPVTGPWDVTYLDYDGPREGRAGQRIRGIVRARNESWRTWSSAGDTPINVSYHWASRGAVVVKDGLRSSLGADLQPGEQRSISLDIELPAQPGRWDLQIDFVEERVTWFSEQGHPPLTIPFSIRR